MAGAKQGRDHEFRVVFRGLDLTDAQAQQINEAVQRAAQQIVADLDFGGDRQAVLIPKLVGRFPVKGPILNGIFVVDMNQIRVAGGGD